MASQHRCCLKFGCCGGRGATYRPTRRQGPKWWQEAPLPRSSLRFPFLHTCLSPFPLLLLSHSVVALSHPSSTLSSCRRRNGANSICNFRALFLSFSFTLFGLSYKKFYKLGNFVFKAFDTCSFRTEEQVGLICFIRIYSPLEIFTAECLWINEDPFHAL
jgi:hypothetical protein